jgi:hypothetical protein
MNNLSIVIYLADVIPSLGGLFTFLSVFSICCITFSAICYFFNRGELKYSERSNYLKEYAAREKESMDLSAKCFRWAVAVFLIAVIPATAIPKRDTIMMIAASEYGETALKSDDVREIIDPTKQILKNWINDQLAQSEKKK